MLKASPKKRFDQAVLELGLASDLKEAQALILARRIEVQPPLSTFKPGTLVPPGCRIILKSISKYVSRGGDKLKAALDFWGISVKNHVCLDVGSSTGGFTDCLLQEGARLVHALDVGRAQADPKIRQDPRVRLHEQTHVLEWSPDWKEPPDFTTVDVSFISLQKVFFRLKEILPPGCTVLALVKPQFEAEPRDLEKGIVKNPKVREEAILKVEQFARSSGFSIAGRFPCPVKGAKGNEEEWLKLIG